MQKKIIFLIFIAKKLKWPKNAMLGNYNIVLLRGKNFAPTLEKDPPLTRVLETLLTC